MRIEFAEDSIFLKKTLSSFQEVSLAELEGGENAGGGRLSCCI